jgi:hypothetical protein
LVPEMGLTMKTIVFFSFCIVQMYDFYSKKQPVGQEKIQKKNIY